MAALSSELFVATAAAAAWALIDAARVGDAVPAGFAFVALLGTTSLLLGAVVVAVNHSRPVGSVVRAVVLGALLASLPLAVVAKTLQRVTHHRPLAGVTYAFAALLVVGVCVACAARLLQVARSEGRGARPAKVVLFASVALSVVGTLAPFLLGARAPSASPLLPSVVDAVLGAAALAVAFVTPLPLSTRAVARYGGVVWGFAVALGVASAVAQPSRSAALASRAPVAFAAVSLCGG